MPNPPRDRDDSSQNAALKGAFLAFQKSIPKPPSTTTPSSRTAGNDALIAATSASRDQSRTTSRHTTGNSVQSNAKLEAEQGSTSQSAGQHLQPSSEHNHRPSTSLGLTSKQSMTNPRSPSFIAATLAASRSASPVRLQSTQQHPYSQQAARKLKRHSPTPNQSAASSMTSLDLATDTTSIPPTNALISMFEKKEDDTDPIKKTTAASGSRKLRGLGPESQPLSPPRTISPVSKIELSPPRLASSMAWNRAVSPSSSSIGSTIQESSSEPQSLLVEVKGRPPTPPPTRAKKKEINASAQIIAAGSKGKLRASTPSSSSTGQTDPIIISPHPGRHASQKIILNDKSDHGSVSKGQTRPPITGSQSPASLHNVQGPFPPKDKVHRRSTSSNDTFVSASSALTLPLDSPVRGRSRPSSPTTIRPKRPMSSQPVSTTTTFKTRPPAPPRRRQQPQSQIPLDSLTDAIMAGSLASSRLTPSSTGPASPPKLPPRHKHALHMRQTLRQPPSKSDEEDNSSRARSRRRKSLGKLGGKGKHAHHEGARKRWRDEITARERKRYEGVWASNRGLLLASPDEQSFPPQGQNANPEKEAQRKREWEEKKEQLVANVIVRDLWARSRLPFDELAEVWDLVDRRGKGFLDRSEFVVGMWLVDQRLRGRKIPRKVSESVWGSARDVMVVAVKNKK